MVLLTEEAADVVRLMRELGGVEESTLQVVEQLLGSKPSRDLILSLLHEKERAVAVALFKTTRAAHSARVLGFVLRFFADLVVVSNVLGRQLGLPTAEELFGDDPADFFLYLVTAHHEESGVVKPALFLAATTLRYAPMEKNEEALRRFFAHVSDVLSAETLQVSSISFEVQGCAIIARTKALRSWFFEEKMVRFLPRLLFEIVATDSASIIQLVYETLLLSWLLSYEYKGVVELQQEKMIPHLHRVLHRLQKEKCIRVALLTLWNMVEAERQYIAVMTDSSSTEWVNNSIYELGRLNGNKGPAIIAEMVSVGMLKTLTQLSRRKFGDEDISVLVEQLKHVLENSMEKLTSFSEYRGEVLSGALEWTPVHTSVKFWRENVMHFEDNDYEVLVALGNLIMTARRDLTLSVACYDLGEVVRHHPTGKALLLLPRMEGVKNRVMALMSHGNSEVAKNALLAVQKIMVQRWEYIQEQP